jgi:3-hydroxyisobutyrate dehydrogenase-like beta-hydroxyacid dehydrogenase
MKNSVSHGSRYQLEPSDIRFKPVFETGGLELHRKDLNLALDGARKLNLSLPNTATCQELFNSAVASGGGRWDHSGLVRVLEKLAAHEIGNE